MNPDASPVLLLSPLYNFTLSTDAQIVENALELVLLLVQSSNDVRKAMLGAAHAEQQKPTRVPEVRLKCREELLLLLLFPFLSLTRSSIACRNFHDSLCIHWCLAIPAFELLHR